MAEMQLFNLPGLVQAADTVNANRQQNRLLQLMEPYKLREVERNEQDALASQNDATLKRNAAAARIALDVMGDLSEKPPEIAQQRFMTARQLVGDIGIDISRIPEQFTPEVYAGIQALAAQYGGTDPTKYQFGGDIVTQDAQGNPLVGTLRRDPTKGVVEFVSTGVGGRLTDKTGLTPQDRAALEAATAGNVEAQKILARIGLTGQVAASEAQVAAATETAKGQAGGAQRSIDQAIELANAAAPGIAPIARALELMDEVKTGGLTQTALQRFREATGSESADAGELSGLLGKSVLAQLRMVFGAAFTQAEGDRLAQIEAGFGKSQATNRRLLQNAMDTAKAAVERGIRAAEKRGDDFTADELRRQLNFRLGEARQSAAGGRQSLPAVDARGWRLMVDGNGVQAYVSPDGTQFEEVR